ncbi:MAG: ABC transporter permease [Trueperaceae bacterium]
MAGYLGRRMIYMVVLLLLLSFVSFLIIQLPPGDYLSTMVARMRSMGLVVDPALLENYSRRYGLDLPLHRQYLVWFGSLLNGDLGESFIYGEPVLDLIKERILLSAALTFGTLIVTYVIAVPIGIYSATNQYSPMDYVFTVLGFIGLAVPNFLLALILMFLAFKYFGWSVGGLFSREYVVAPWSWGKFVDLLKHLPIPLFVIGTAGTASLIRILRGSLLDELRKQYVTTARAKGVPERRLLFKYPVRIAINPIISHIGYLLPMLVAGETLTSIVLSLPTVGPLLLQALQQQDMYLAGSLLMVLGVLALIGVLLSDILLVIVDPRIRFEAGESA